RGSDPLCFRPLLEHYVAVDAVHQAAGAPGADQVVRAGRIDLAAVADVDVRRRRQREVSGHAGVVQRERAAIDVDAAADRVGGIEGECLAGSGVGVDGVEGEHAAGHRHTAGVVDAAAGQVDDAVPRAGVDGVEGNQAAADRPALGREAAAGG